MKKQQRINYSSTTPPAPPGGVLVHWQDDGLNRSAYIDESELSIPDAGGIQNAGSPPSSTDKGLVRWVGTGGDLVEDTSGPLLEDDGRISNVTDPTNNQDAATKKYVDDNAGTSGATVEAKTNGSGAPYAVSSTTDKGKTFTNEGASAEVYFSLPAAATSVGPYTFICQDADLLRIIAGTGDTIRLYDNVSATAGYIKAVAIGATVTLVAINATEWLAVAVVGEWDVN